MELNPQRVRSAEFKTAKRGLDPEEVRRFLGEVADQLELAQNQSTAMEARARAAVARLQELSDGASTQAAAASSDDVATASAEQAETISRTLLLAQRTADTTIAEAQAERQRLIQAATDEAAATLDSTREMSARLMDEAREEARRLGESERMAVASEVDSLKARRDFLESDVAHLEQFLAAERARLRAAADAMIELTERATDGLGEVRRPLLSAADDDDDEVDVVADDEAEAAFDPLGAAEADDAGAIGGDEGALVVEAEPFVGEFAIDDGAEPVSPDPTPTSFAAGHDTGGHDRPEPEGEIRFSFDDRR